MRLIIATDEIGEEPLVNYVDAETFARVYFLVMENKSQHRDAQLRIGADDAGHSEPCPPDRHMYYQGFLNYQYCPYCGERVHS